MKPARVLHSIFLALATGLPSCATERTDGKPERQASQSQAIVGGVDVASCAWPSVVYLAGELEGHCTGTLIHPEIVLFAAHCLRDGAPPPSHALFAEHAATPARSVPIENCFADPQFSTSAEVGNGHDVAYCKLTQAVTDVPIVPVASSCTVPTAGMDLIAVGFGEEVKRAVPLPLVERVGNEVYIGGAGKGTCYGDSGGPLFARDEAGQLRVLAVVSWAPGECGDGEYASLVGPSLPFLEASSNRSLAPCPECGAIPALPEQSQGSWQDGCRGPIASDEGKACAADEAEEDVSPTRCSFGVSGDASGWAVLLALALFRRRPRQSQNVLVL